MSEDQCQLTIPTPGAYLKARRLVKGLCLAEVAARLRTDPSIAELDRVEWLKLIESDAMPASFSTIVALSTLIDFNMGVLIALDMVAQGILSPDMAPQICVLCGSRPHDTKPEFMTWTGPRSCPACTTFAPPAEPAKRNEDTA
ncbi:XRE family transcriptional regulator [uncultured Sphingomonas sp.]|uniref:helix-turn-helix domain-containing protein n=1 Tax=uncultured Sphingomonas sp. TaxID=158754 RepID=UPI0025E7CB83|nr:XRE family transcriptional regulator [uncultured Sphingomonas sp.]